MSTSHKQWCSNIMCPNGPKDIIKFYNDFILKKQPTTLDDTSDHEASSNVAVQKCTKRLETKQRKSSACYKLY